MSKVSQWNRYRVKLKKVYLEKDIINCEIRLLGCWIYNGLSFHHRHKRVWYDNTTEKVRRGGFLKIVKRKHLLGDFEQTLQTCPECHWKLEKDKELSQEYFKKLRDDKETNKTSDY